MTTWVAKHPFQTAHHLLNAFIIVEPKIATTPLFYLAGAGKEGPRRGIRAPRTFDYLQLIASRLAHLSNDELAWVSQGRERVRASSECGDGRL